MDHRDLYKNVVPDVLCVREKKRQEQSDVWHNRRARVLSRKRAQLDDQDPVSEIFTSEQVQAAAVALVKKTGKVKETLSLLRRAFIHGSHNRDTFLSVDNALGSVVGLLTGQDCELQLEAAWLLANLAAGTDQHGLAVAKQAGPYLVTFLSSGNTPLQGHCCWALGNILGGSQCTDLLQAQGVISPLISLLQSSSTTVVQAASFALGNLFRNDHSCINELVEHGILPALQQHLVVKFDNLDVVAEVTWTLMYFCASDVMDSLGVSPDLVHQLLATLVQVTQIDPHNLQVVTGVIRCLGNLSCGMNSELVRDVFDRPAMLCLTHLLDSRYQHIRKECLWLLSNITVYKVCCQVLMSSDLLTKVIHLLTSSPELKIQVLFCLNNLACQGKEECEALVSAQVLQCIIPCMCVADRKLVTLGLTLCHMLLANTVMGVQVMEQCGGVKHLESLSLQPETSVQQQAAFLLHVYYSSNPQDG